MQHANRKLLFHIGHHKTGSTSIQNAFATGQVKLQGGRILYPARLSHNYLRRNFETYLRDGQILPGTSGFPGLGALSELLGNGDFDVAVISGESFENARPAGVRKVLQDFMLPHVTDHAVICYIRPHAARLLSGYAENLKVGLFSDTLDRFAEMAMQEVRQQFAPKLQQWDNVFGRHFLLRPLIRSDLVNGSVLQDFIHTGFGPNAPVTIGTDQRANESLCIEDLLLVRLVQDQLNSRNRPLQLLMGWELASNFAASARTGTGTKLMLHRGLAERIRATYRNDAELLDTRYFGGRALFRAELDRSVDEALPEPQSLDPEDYFGADALRALTAMAQQINVLLDHKSGPWPDFLRQRRIDALHGKTAPDDDT